MDECKPLVPGPNSDEDGALVEVPAFTHDMVKHRKQGHPHPKP